MQVGLISDTHGFLHDSVLQIFDGVDKIIHAGDVDNLSVIYELQAIAPVIAVLGNNDYANLNQFLDPKAEPLIGGLRFRVTHFPQDLHFPEDGIDVFVHGHTHIPKLVQRAGKVLVNPGSASRPRGGSKRSVAIMTIEDAKVQGVEFREF